METISCAQFRDFVEGLASQYGEESWFSIIDPDGAEYPDEDEQLVMLSCQEYVPDGVILYIEGRRDGESLTVGYMLDVLDGVSDSYMDSPMHWIIRDYRGNTLLDTDSLEDCSYRIINDEDHDVLWF